MYETVKAQFPPSIKDAQILVTPSTIPTLQNLAPLTVGHGNFHVLLSFNHLYNHPKIKHRSSLLRNLYYWTRNPPQPPATTR